MHRASFLFLLSAIFLLAAVVPLLGKFLGTVSPSLSRTAVLLEPPPADTIAARHYQLTVDQHVWEQSAAADGRLTLSLRPDFGTAVVELRYHPEPTTVERLLTHYQARYPGATPRNGQLNNHPGVEAIVSESHFGETATFTVQAIPTARGYVELILKTDRLPQTEASVASLLSTLTFSDARVHGAQTRTSRQVSAVSQRATPSVVGLLSLHCYEVTATDARLLPAPHQFCIHSKGSGFIVSPTGSVATNGHTLVVYPEQALTQHVRAASVRPLALKLIAFLEPSASPEKRLEELNTNPTTLAAFIDAVYKLLDRKAIVITPLESRHFVRIGGEPFQFDPDLVARGSLDDAVRTSDTAVPAHVVAASAPNHYSVDAHLRGIPAAGPDVGLLKLDHSRLDRFPALPLAPTGPPAPGSPLLLLGFPETVEGTPDRRSLLKYEVASITPTVTLGIVSAIKQDQTGNTLIQTDAGLASGNSGGPALDDEGRVVGIATFALENQSANFNFVRDIAELKSLLTQHGIDPAAPNPIFESWEQAVASFTNGRYRDALKNAQRVADLFPSTRPPSGSSPKAARGFPAGVGRTCALSPSTRGRGSSPPPAGPRLCWDSAGAHPLPRRSANPRGSTGLPRVGSRWA